MHIRSGEQGTLIIGLVEDIPSSVLYETIKEVVGCNKGYARHLVKVLKANRTLEVRPWANANQNKS